MSKGRKNLKFFKILNKRAHAFICAKCHWISLAKVQTSILRNPDDYVDNHDCSGDDSMGSNSSISMNVPESNKNGHEASSCSHSSLNEERSDFHSNEEGSMVSENVSESSNMSHGNESNRSESIGIDDSMASNVSMGSNISMASNLSMASNVSMTSNVSTRDDSGFRTPDILDDIGQAGPFSQSFRCENRFYHSSETITMKFELKCQFKSSTLIELKDHKSKCPLRYRSKMVKSNPAYLTQFIWSFAKELHISDYLGKRVRIQDKVNIVFY